MLVSYFLASFYEECYQNLDDNLYVIAGLNLNRNSIIEGENATGYLKVLALAIRYIILCYDIINNAFTTKFSYNWKQLIIDYLQELTKAVQFFIIL